MRASMSCGDGKRQVFQTYTQIFSQRARDYHRAMQEQPDARQAEFTAVAVRLQAEPGRTVADAPAGGGYLRRHLPSGVACVAVEPAPDFAGAIAPRAGDRVVECALEALALPDASLDGCISLAGVHHLPDKPAFYREVARTLRPGGRFVLADVAAGSPVDGFLNDYCNRACAMGHEGVFLDERTRAQLQAVGLRTVSDEQVACPWRFASAPAMARFCTLLFGLDLAPDPADVLDGIARHLGTREDAGGVRMHWELRVLSCVRDV